MGWDTTRDPRQSVSITGDITTSGGNIVTTTGAIGAPAGTVSGQALYATDSLACASNAPAGGDYGDGELAAGETSQCRFRCTVSVSELVAAATTQDFTLFTMPAKMRLVAFYAHTTVPYDGAGTVGLTAGITAGGNTILVSHDVKSAPIVRGTLDAHMGTGMTRAAKEQGAYIPSWTDATAVSVRFTSGSGNFGDGAGTLLSTGSTTFYAILEAL